MSSISSEPATAEISDSSKSPSKKILNSHWTFIALQALDLLTTMVAFRMGAYEVNPLVAHLTLTFGRFRGVLISKLIAIGIAMGVRFVDDDGGFPDGGIRSQSLGRSSHTHLRTVP